MLRLFDLSHAVEAGRKPFRISVELRTSPIRIMGDTE
jgi:hypothetical protein